MDYTGRALMVPWVQEQRTRKQEENQCCPPARPAPPIPNSQRESFLTQEHPWEEGIYALDKSRLLPLLLPYFQHCPIFFLLFSFLLTQEFKPDALTRPPVLWTVWAALLLDTEFKIRHCGFFSDFPLLLFPSLRLPLSERGEM